MAYKRISPQPVVEGGTGVQSNTAYAVLCGGTTTTNPIQSIASVGSAGQVLTSNGAGALPTFQALPSISITGDTGGALTGTAFTFTGGTTGLSFNGAVTTQTLTFAGATINAGVVNIGSDSVDNAINIGTAANAGRTVTIGNATGTSSVAINCGTGGVTVGTSANAHSTTVGSTNSTSSTTVQSGSGALNITSTNGALTINSGTGTLGISTDASATTVNIGTGAAVKTVTIGTTNTTSSTAIRSGTGNVAINSGLTIDSSGRNTNAAQPAFSVYVSGATINDVTGDGTPYSIVFDAQTFNIGSGYTLGTSAFTAPVTGRYMFGYQVAVTGATGSNTALQIVIKTTATSFISTFERIANTNQGGARYVNGSILCAMSASDTAEIEVTVAGSTKIIDIIGGVSATRFWGYLVS